MALVNIPKHHVDPFYRYRRELCKLRSGKGNATIWTNVAEIARQLGREPSSLANHAKRKLGTGCSLKNGQATFHGSLSIEQLEDAVEDYVEKYVLCEACGNPETDDSGCRACGQRTNRR